MSELMNDVNVEEAKVDVEDVNLDNVFGDENSDLGTADLEAEGFTATEIAALTAAAVATGVGVFFLVKYVIKPKVKVWREERKEKKEAKRKSKIIEGKFKDVEKEDDESPEE